MNKVVYLKPTETQIEEYINAVSKVTCHAYAISETRLPVLSICPKWYGDYAEKLSVAQSHCFSWINGVLNNIEKLPEILIDYNELIQRELNSLIAGLTSFKIENGNKDTILSQVNNLKLQTDGIYRAIENLYESIEEFIKDLDVDEGILSEICVEAEKSSQFIEEDVKKLNTSIYNLQKLIYDKSQLVKINRGLKIDVAVAITLVNLTVGAVFKCPTTLILGAFSGLVAGYEFLIVEEPDVKELQEEIINIEGEINEVNTSISLMANTSLAFKELASGNKTSYESMFVIKDIWVSALRDIISVTDCVAELVNEIEKQSIDEIITSIEMVAKEWNEIQGFASTLNKIKYNLNKEILEVSKDS